MWLMLGAAMNQLPSGVLGVGVLTGIRQLSTIVGTLIGGVIADHGRVLIRQLWTEGLQLVSALVLLVTISPLISLSGEQTTQAFLLWSLFRFGIGGVSFVLGFRLLAVSQKSLGNTARTHLLVNQGATLFAPVLGLALPLITPAPLIAAVIFDALTTLAYIFALLRARGTELDVTRNDLEIAVAENSSLGTRLFDSAFSLWRDGTRPWNALQFLSLFAISGYAVFCLQTAVKLQGGSLESRYAFLSLLYGIALWGVALWSLRKSPTESGLSGSKLNRLRSRMMAGATFLACSGVIDFILPGQRLNAQGLLLVSFACYVFAFWLLLDCTNQGVLLGVSSEKAGKVRSSMVFHLCLIFGVAEGIFGWLYSLGDVGVLWIGGSRILLGIALAGFVLLLVRKSR